MSGVFSFSSVHLITMTRKNIIKELIALGSILLFSFIVFWIYAGFNNPLGKTVWIYIDSERVSTTGLIAILHVFLLVGYLVYSVRQLLLKFKSQAVNWILSSTILLLIIFITLNLLDFSAQSRCGCHNCNGLNTVISTLLWLMVLLLLHLIYSAYRTGKNKD